MQLVMMLAVLAAPAAQDENRAALVDDAKVEAAIHKGIEYLKGAGSPGHAHSKAKHSDELILYTFLHAGVPEDDPKFQQMLKRVLTDELHQTYKVALQAMCLEELERVKYQNRIAQCAQHLVDNQCPNGQWSYGKPTIFANEIPSVPTSVSTRSRRKKRGGLRIFRKPGERIKPEVKRKIPIKQKRQSDKASGDNSNTQYAALGLRACFDSGIVFEEHVIERAMQWWYKSQHQGIKESGYGGVRGWNYRTEGGDKGRKAYGSMTAGATGSLAIYRYMQGKDPVSDTSLKAGLNWIASNFTVKENPGRGKSWYFYYLYGLERAGVLCDTVKFGKHDWYVEGANHLLKIQQGNGSWKGDHADEWNTCFAILFLKRATRPLVASEDR